MVSRAHFTIFLQLLLVSCGGSSSGPSSTLAPAAANETKLQASGASAALPPAQGTPRLSVDKIGDVLDPRGKAPVAIPIGGDITVSGFAIDEPAQSLASGVDIVIDGLAFTAHYHIDRPDVATYFKMPAYSKSGYQFTMPAKFFGKGQHTLTAREIAADGKSYRELAPFTIDIQ
jgi:hypothetical protein